MRAEQTNDRNGPWHIRQVLDDWIDQHQTDLFLRRRTRRPRPLPAEHRTPRAGIMSGDGHLESGMDSSMAANLPGDREDASCLWSNANAVRR